MNLLCAGPANTANNLLNASHQHARKISKAVPSPIKFDCHSNFDCPHTNVINLKIAVKNSYSDYQSYVEKDLGILSDVIDENILNLVSKIANESNQEGSSFSSITKRLIALVGHPGCGKTTLCLSMLSQILSKKVALKNYYLFYISLSNIDFDAQTDFVSLILKGCSNDISSTEVPEKLIHKLSNASNILFIFDDLDVLSAHDLQSALGYEINLSDLNKPSVLIMGILSGQIFPNSFKLFTCSPWSIPMFSIEFKPSCVVSILGMDKISQAEVCRQICGENADAVALYMSQVPGSSVFCRTSVLCTLLYYAMSSDLSRQEEILFTKCLIQTLNMYLYSQIQLSDAVSQQLLHLAQFAWKATLDENSSDKSFQFKSSDVFISRKVVQLFLFEVEKSKYIFLNSIWKDLFCAIHITLSLSLEDFCEFLSQLDRFKWKTIVRFVFGLQNQSSCNKLKDTFSSHKFEMWNEKRSMLTGFLIKCLANVIDTDGACYETETFLQICEWLYEMHSDEILRKINPLLPDVVRLNGCLKRNNVLSLYYVLEKCNECFVVEFGPQINFFDGCLHEFLSCMEKIHKQHPFCQHSNKDVKLMMLKEFAAIRINESQPSNDCLILQLCDWVLKDQDFEHVLLSNFPDVIYLDGKIPDDSTCVSSLVAILQKVAKPLTFKFGTSINISDDTLLQLLQGICVPSVKVQMEATTCTVNKANSFGYHVPKIGSLKLFDTITTNSGLEVLCHMLSAFPYQIGCLELCKSNFKQLNILLLQDVLCKIERLDLSSCNFDRNDFVSFLNFISSLPCPLQLLNLDFVDTPKSILVALSKCLHNIDTVVLRDCRLTTIDRKKDGMLIDPEQSHLVKCLSFTRRIKDNPVTSIIDGMGLNKIDNLILRECKITSKSCKLIAAKLKARAGSPMQSIELGFNKLGDKGVMYLSGCLHKVDKISLWDCGITVKGTEVLSKQIALLELPLKKVDLSFNEVGDKGILAICTCLHKIEELDLAWCGITSEGIKELSLAIAKLESPIKCLNLDENKFGEEGCLVLAECLENIKKLSIRQCDVTYAACRVMKDKIDKFAKPKPSVTGVD